MTAISIIQCFAASNSTFIMLHYKVQEMKDRVLLLVIFTGT